MKYGIDRLFPFTSLDLILIPVSPFHSPMSHDLVLKQITLHLIHTASKYLSDQVILIL